MNSESQYQELSDSQLREIQKNCERFEKAIQQGERLSIEEQIATVAPEIQSRLFQELIAIELAWRAQKDELLELAEYENRFPDRIAEIRRSFAEINSGTDRSLEDTGLLTDVIGDSFTGAPPTTGHAAVGAHDRIGGYTLLQRIGEGGMGVVWMAQQKEPVRRKVALKIIKAGMDTHEVIARFEAERQALALMSHPNIAKVFDAGATETGRPYFVMELVKGEPITSFCDRHRMTADQRIGLFMDVCHAVQHAHQRGIIHRDIKPSNVLATMHESRPIVKVIDFGLAKAISQRLTEKTLFTAVGQVVGTPAYMSPEQIEKGGWDIDTRTDVYSLGVLLYELLTGVTPLDRQRLRDAGYAELQRMICEQEPPRMKRRLSSLGKDSDTAAENRSTDIRKLNRRLDGDLDVIVMCSLAREPDRRYATPGDFADDLQRFLDREPIEARPASAVYRLRKLAERNKGKFLAASLLVLALAGGFVGTALGLFEAQRQTARAESNLITAEENYELARQTVDRYFISVSENRLLNEPYMADLRRELLASAREFYQSFVERRKDDPDALLDLANAHFKLGTISEKMGDRDQARSEIEACREMATRAAAVFDSAESQRLLLSCDIADGQRVYQLGEFAAAIEMLDHASAAGSVASESYPDDETIRHHIATICKIRGDAYRDLDRQDLAEKQYRSCIAKLDELSRQSSDNSTYPGDIARTLDHLGGMLQDQDRFAEAQQSFNQAIDIWRDQTSREPKSVKARHGLADSLMPAANLYRRQGKLEKAVELGTESVDIGRELVSQHPELITMQDSLIKSQGSLSVIYKVAGRRDESDALNRETMTLIAQLSKRFPDDTFYSLRLGGAQGNEGNAKLDRKQWQDAIDWYDRSNKTLQHRLNKSPDDPRARLIVRNNHWGRADAFLAMERYDEAIHAYDAAIVAAKPTARPQLKLDRATVFVRKGEPETAIDLVESLKPDINMELLNRKSNVALIWFMAGRVLMAAAEATEKSSDVEELAEGEHEHLANLHEQVMLALEKAHEFGYFNKPKSQPLYEDEFNSLREYPRFQKLIKDAEAAPDPDPSEF